MMSGSDTREHVPHLSAPFAHLSPVPRPAGPSPQRDALCAQLAPDQSLVRLAVEAPQWAEVGAAVQNAARMGATRGGRVELGWQLWEALPRVLLEAEFHAVWLDPAGVRHDVTPKAHPKVTAIRFLPDPGLTDAGGPVASHRAALVDDDDVRALIDAEDLFFAARGAGPEHHDHARSINADRVRLASAIIARYFYD